MIYNNLSDRRGILEDFSQSIYHKSKGLNYSKSQSKNA